MEYFQIDELEYVLDDDYFDMMDSEDDPFGQYTASNRKSSDGLDCEEDDDDVDVSKAKTDTSASEARSGKDIQGIPWERLNFTRERYRETRPKQYKNYENLSRSRAGLEKECKQVEKGSAYYDFQFNTRLIKSTIVHFQVLHILNY